MRVLLVQLPVPNNPATNMPLAAGYLRAFAHAQGLDRASAAGPGVEIDILPRRIADYAGDAFLVETLVAYAPDVLGFSLYTWNSQRSLDIARRVKAQLPEVIVVGGGPEVQRDNIWLLHHPGLDLAVIGEGEQTFVELVRRLRETRDRARLADIPGLSFRVGDQPVFTPPRVALADLSVVPSPYLLGYLEVQPGSMALVEVSRWCPYTCSFCLYGRNMSAKLGNRYFGLERVLAEIAWVRQRGAAALHFVEANLNLVPFFGPLLRALEDLNADRSLHLYAELRGEHLREDVVAALVRAGLRVAEVGLQTANPVALAASRRKTDLQKWAAGTRRLLAHNVEVLLDVILGLPADDRAGVRTTLDFIAREELGTYDTFMLQVLPGTPVREQAEAFGIVYQEHPPYYVLQTDRMQFADLQQLRRELKLGAGLDPDAIDGLPAPRVDALQRVIDPASHPPAAPDTPVDHVVVTAPYVLPQQRLATHVDLVVPSSELSAITPALHSALAANPSTLFDLYLLCDDAPDPALLRAWHASCARPSGYLDDLAVYQGVTQVSPRLWLVLPWTAQVEPAAFAPDAGLIWRYDLAPGDEPPLGAWRVAGGAGVWVPGAATGQMEAWRAATGLLFWR